MGWSSEDLAALEDAIKQGVRRVKYSDREVEYRSLPEMLQLRDMMKRELGQTKRGPLRYVAEFNKGLGK